MKELADSWADASGGAEQAYLANFDAAGNLTDDLFFAAFLALGLYLTALAAAILTGGVYARWDRLGRCRQRFPRARRRPAPARFGRCLLRPARRFRALFRCAYRSRRVAVATGGRSGVERHAVVEGNTSIWAVYEPN